MSAIKPLLLFSKLSLLIERLTQTHRLLLISNGKFQSIQSLSLAETPDFVGRLVVEVEHHLELHGCACVVQKRGSEVLHHLTHLLLGKHKQRHSHSHSALGAALTLNNIVQLAYRVFGTKLRFHRLQALEFPGQLEGGQYRVPGAKCYQRAGRESPVGVDPRLRVAQGVRRLGGHTLIAAAPGGI